MAQPMTHPASQPRPLEALQGGWSPLPLPRGEKSPPPDGWTGRDAPMASLEDVQGWGDFGNMAIRFPADVIGLDVDDYDGKGGAHSFRQLTAPGWPLTYVITARDGQSGTRLYRLPPGVDESQLWGSMAGVDIIRHSHRYQVGPGSQHPSGRIYTVTDEATGEISAIMPAVSELPELSMEQAQKLIKPKGEARPKLDSSELCSHMAQRMATAIFQLGDLSLGSRHDQVRGEILAIVRMGEEGHTGALTALDRLGKVYLAELMSPGSSRKESPAKIRAEWERMVEGALDLVQLDPTPASRRKLCGSDVSQGPEPADDLGPARLPASFWAARLSLGHIRQAARSKRIGSDGLLLACLIRASCGLDPIWVLPDIVGVPQSVNLFGALVVGSGGGKSSAKALAAQLVKLPEPLPMGLGMDGEEASTRGTTKTVSMGTAEGILDSFGTQEGQHPWQKGQWAVLVDADELDHFMASMKQGANTSAQLRMMWSGEQLGGSYRGKMSKAKIARQDYRLGLLVGAQPQRTAPLLNGAEAHGGTPQRFIWLTTLMEPGIEAEWPGELEWEPWWQRPGAPIRAEGMWGFTDSNGQACNRYGIRVDEKVRAQVIHEHEVQASSMESELRLDGHRNLLRLRTAVALGLLDRPAEDPQVTWQDWTLAGQLLDVSDEIREWMTDLGRKARISDVAGTLQTKRSAERTIEHDIERIGGVIVRALLKHGPQNKKQLKARLAQKDRPMLDEVLEQLLAAGRIVRAGAAGTHYEAGGEGG